MFYLQIIISEKTAAMLNTDSGTAGNISIFLNLGIKFIKLIYL